MKKVLFLIHDLGQGGAEKVLLNLVNNMDYSKFDVTVMTLFDHGENRQFIGENVKYKTWCKTMIRGNSHFMKLLSPQMLHKMIIKEHYDVEVSYLEGPCARVISGCRDAGTKLVSWIHIEQHTTKKAAKAFRSIKEAKACYSTFDRIISVSKSVENDFKSILQVPNAYDVLYNTNESKKIQLKSKESIEDVVFSKQAIKLIGVGKLLKSKGFDRLLRITKRLIENQYCIHLYILGEGPERKGLEKFIVENDLQDNVTLLGYQLNPYKYIANCDLFVCASHAEGFSTAATEALIVGTPVCTVEVSGMKEMLGDNNEYGIVTNNDDEALFDGIKSLLDNPNRLEHYTQKALERGKSFSTQSTVNAVEDMLLDLMRG